MPDSHVPRQLCAKVGHVISVTLVVRCLHDESVSISTHTYIDHQEDEQTTLQAESWSAGPFDSTAEVLSRYHALNASAMTSLMDALDAR